MYTVYDVDVASDEILQYSALAVSDMLVCCDAGNPSTSQGLSQGHSVTADVIAKVTAKITTRIISKVTAKVTATF